MVKHVRESCAAHLGPFTPVKQQSKWLANTKYCWAEASNHTSMWHSIWKIPCKFPAQSVSLLCTCFCSLCGGSARIKWWTALRSFRHQSWHHYSGTNIYYSLYYWRWCVPRGHAKETKMVMHLRHFFLSIRRVINPITTRFSSSPAHLQLASFHCCLASPPAPNTLARVLHACVCCMVTISHT